MSESRFLSGKRLSLFAIFVSRPAETGYRTVRLHRTAVPFSDSEQRHKASRLKISATGQKTKPSGHMRFATARPYLKRDLLAAFLFHSSYNNADRPPRTGKRPADRKRARTEAAEQAPCPIVSDKTGLPNVNEDNPTGPRIPYATYGSYRPFGRKLSFCLGRVCKPVLRRNDGPQNGFSTTRTATRLRKTIGTRPTGTSPGTDSHEPQAIPTDNSNYVLPGNPRNAILRTLPRDRQRIAASTGLRDTDRE